MFYILPEGSWKERTSQCVQWTSADSGCLWSSLEGSPPGSHDPRRSALSGSKEKHVKLKAEQKYVHIHCAKCIFAHVVLQGPVLGTISELLKHDL